MKNNKVEIFDPEPNFFKKKYLNLILIKFWLGDQFFKFIFKSWIFSTSYNMISDQEWCWIFKNIMLLRKISQLEIFELKSKGNQMSIWKERKEYCHKKWSSSKPKRKINKSFVGIKIIGWLKSDASCNIMIG